MDKLARPQSSKNPCPLMWHWGFIYDTPQIFALARRLKAQGGSGPRRAPLPNIDFSQDPQDEDVEDAVPTEAETHRLMAMLNWSTEYLQDYVCMYHIACHIRFVHNRRSGRDERLRRCVAFAHIEALHFRELEGRERMSDELPGDDKLEKLTELLGPPAWYMDFRSAYMDDIGPRLKTGEFQAEEGMPVVHNQVRLMHVPLRYCRLTQVCSTGHRVLAALIEDACAKAFAFVARWEFLSTAEISPSYVVA